MFFAEVIAGSFPLWFLDPWGILVTFPLYLIHALFFLNLAFRTERTTLPQLYLWGVLFGLYESWITKVVFLGYPGEAAPILPVVAGIAWWEFFSVVLFWHPIMSFIVPILVFELLSTRTSPREERIIRGHDLMLNATPRNKLVPLILIIAGAMFLATSSGFDIEIVVVTILGSLFIILIFLIAARKYYRDFFSLHTLTFQKKGFALITLAFLLLNTILFVLIFPDGVSLPEVLPLPGVLIVVAWYAGVLMLLRMSPPGAFSYLLESGGEQSKYVLFSERAFWIGSGLYTILAVGFCLVGEVTAAIGSLFMGAMFLFAPVLFGIMVFRVLRDKRVKSNSMDSDPESG